MSFSIHEWLYFSQLLQKGYKIEMCLSLMNKANDSILLCLEQGRRIEDLVVASCKGRFQNLVAFFIQVTGLAEALQCSVVMFRFESQMKQKIMKQTAYPLFILLFAFLTIFMFSTYIIPQLIQNFEANDNFLFVVVDVIRSVSVGFIYFVFGLLLLGMLCKVSQRALKRVGVFLIGHSKFVREMMSYYFSNYLIILDECGLSTQQAFLFMNDIRKQVLLHYIIHKIYTRLCNGEELIKIVQENELLSKNFKLHYTLGSASNMFCASLTTYRDLQEQRWMNQIKRFGFTIQIVAYSFVGILVLCVYQIMLIPLQLLERM